MSSLLAFTPWIGGACCCLAFFVLLIVIATFLFRGKRSRPEEIEGLPKPPAAGEQTRASLTMLEYEPTQRTPRPGVTPRPLGSSAAVPPPPAPAPASAPPSNPFADIPDGDGQTTLLDRGGRASLPPVAPKPPGLPPPPPPPPGTITRSPTLPPKRILEPTPTATPGPSGPPPLPKPDDER